MVQANFVNFAEHVGQSKRAWQDHALFLYKIITRECVEHFSMIPFKLSTQWNKLVLLILPSMADSPKGRGMATPLFCYKVIAQEWLNIFARFFLHLVGNNQN